MNIRFIGLVFLFFLGCSPQKERMSYDIVIIGEGTGAVAATIAAARRGVQVLHMSHLPWIGGMLTAAGVSATDGNHDIAGGLWREFRDSLWEEYGGEEALFTGWVSKTCFEPSVGERVWKNMVKNEANIRQELDLQEIQVMKEEGEWIIRGTRKEGSIFWVKPKIIIDGTDLGDIAAQMNVPFDLGMEAREKTEEEAALEQENTLIQDLTYVAILEPSKKQNTLKTPQNKERFHCSCAKHCNKKDVLDCQKMLDYALLPHGKYMINWPRKGNDYYASAEELMGPTGYEITRFNDALREAVYQKSKQKTMDFVQYIQNGLGFDSLVISQGEFGTEDGLAWMPYYREGRRIQGLSRLTLNEILRPFDSPMYQQGIAVGDYPVDHHHLEKENIPEIEFPKIPSYAIPLGCLIPADEEQLIMADKAISVSNLANGTTRLQPVVIGLGQAAGTLAAMAVSQKIKPREVSIRAVQYQLIKDSAYIMPYYDVSVDSSYFGAVQRIGATGIMRGEGEAYQWANRTWFYPGKEAKNVSEVLGRLNALYGENWFDWTKSTMNIKEWKTELDALSKLGSMPWNEALEEAGLPIKEEETPLSRGQLAVLIDLAFDPFHAIPVTYE